jgi:hypothetical protein
MTLRHQTLTSLKWCAFHRSQIDVGQGGILPPLGNRVFRGIGLAVR